MTRGETMRAARERAGLTVRGLAAKAGVCYMTVSRIENDETSCSLTSAELLADALGLSLDEYTGHEVKRNG